jgi:hypothetical protein
LFQIRFTKDTLLKSGNTEVVYAMMGTHFLILVGNCLVGYGADQPSSTEMLLLSSVRARSCCTKFSHFLGLSFHCIAVGLSAFAAVRSHSVEIVADFSNFTLGALP